MTPAAETLPPSHEHPISMTLRIAGVFVVSVMPVFLTAASGVFLREELGFDEAGLGLAISAFFGTFALVTAFTSRLAERIGGGKSLKLAAFASSALLLNMALFVRSFTQLIIFLVIGGLINSVAEPSTNLAMARVRAVRQALLFGLKQSATPTVTLLAGASVPLIALTFGWRWAFATGSALAFLIGVLMPADHAPPRSRGESPRMRDGDVGTVPMMAMAIAAGFGTSAAASLGSFTVESAVAAGIGVGTAGWLLVGSSVTSICFRLLFGWMADGIARSALTFVSALLLIGAVGYALLGVQDVRIFPIGAVIAFSFGWGWVGVMMFAIVRLNPNAPGAATGIVLVGGAGGAAIGPALFGVLVTRFSYQVAWTGAATMAVASALLILGVQQWIRHDRDRLTAPTG